MVWCNRDIDQGSLGVSYVSVDWKIKVVQVVLSLVDGYERLFIKNISSVYMHGHIIKLKPSLFSSLPYYYR